MYEVSTLLVYQYGDFGLACLRKVNIVFGAQLYLSRSYVIISVENSSYLTGNNLLIVKRMASNQYYQILVM